MLKGQKMGTRRKVINKHFQNEGSHVLHYSLRTQVQKSIIHPEIWGGGDQIKMYFLYSKVTFVKKENPHSRSEGHLSPFPLMKVLLQGQS